MEGYIWNERLWGGEGGDTETETRALRESI